MSDDLIQVASFSGGRTSAYLCSLLLERYPRDRLRFVFMDTGAEHPATYDFIRKVNDHFGLDLICLRCDSSRPLGKGVYPYVVSIDDIGQDLVPFRDLSAKYGTPTAKTPACTSRMKERIFSKWCQHQFGRDQYVAWIGVRADEPKRLGKMGLSPLMRFLAELDDADKQDVLAYWRDMPFDLEIPEWLGNCVFCIKKSDAKLALAVREEPDMAEEWMTMLREATNRTKPEGLTSENVYRSSRTLLQVISSSASLTTDELRAKVMSYRNDSNTCAESCEVFVGATQLSLFEMSL